MTRRIDCSPGHLPETEKGTLQKVLRRGGIIAFPTTVYGLAASALDQTACEKIYRIKGRPKEKGLILMSDKMEKIRPYLKKIPPGAQKLLDHLPTGSLTLILPAAETLPSHLNPEGRSVGFRLADNPVTRELMALIPEPLATTSANLSGRPPCLQATELEKTFDGEIDLILQWDEAIGGSPSTILDLTGKTPVILRAGRVLETEILKILKM